MFKNIANMDFSLEKEDYTTNVITEAECELEVAELPVSQTSNRRCGALFCAIAVLAIIAGGIGCKYATTIDTSNSLFSGIFSENVLNEVVPEASVMTAADSKHELITVRRSIVKADPFMPYRDVSVSFNAPPKFELLEPPEYANEGSEAGRVMDTSVSGILYDVYSPSAILNIEGVDQLVKKGDVISNYHILDIDKNSVTVKLGANIYRAGIGEILTSNEEIHYNKVSNLDRKFGGKNGN